MVDVRADLMAVGVAVGVGPMPHDGRIKRMRRQTC